MADVYSSITDAAHEIQESLAKVLELRAADFQQRDMLKTYLGDIEFTEVPNPAVSITSGKKFTKRAKISSPTPLADAGATTGEEDDSSPDEAEEAVGVR